MTMEIFWSKDIKHVELQFKHFVQRMANRLMVGYFRYGPPRKEQKYLSRLKMELRAYTKTGNGEHLGNIANYALLEHIAPEHKNYHFNPLVESVTRGKIKGGG